MPEKTVPLAISQMSRDLVEASRLVGAGEYQPDMYRATYLYCREVVLHEIGRRIN